MKNSLRGGEFQRVYQGGRRYDSSLLSVFVLPNKIGVHRLGITASKKTIGKAIDRNRAKRLLRETFRLSQPTLRRLERSYDWVVNGRRRLVSSKIQACLFEFQKIIGAVANDETVSE